jgi:hypothetical protein
MAPKSQLAAQQRFLKDESVRIKRCFLENPELRKKAEALIKWGTSKFGPITVL